MNYLKAVEFLLDNGCPSIVYRTRKEILGEPSNTSSMIDLQEQILNTPEVKRIISLQKEDGWLGGAFHGTDEPESGIRFLSEMGVESENLAITRALEAIEQRGKDFDDGGLVRVGKLLDQYHIGGSQMIKACVFAYARHENKVFVQEQIKEAISAFEYVANLKTITNIYRLHKDKILVFEEMVKWPSIYHLRLLAFTQSWRNDSNLDILSRAFNNLIEFSPIPNIKLLHKNQVISPASLFMNNFNPDMNQIKPKDWMIWFHRSELIARLGIVDNLDAIKNQVQFMNKLLCENNGLFTKRLSHYYFNRWTAYLGLALQDDWKDKHSRTCDLTFRSLLILKLTGQLSL